MRARVFIGLTSCLALVGCGGIVSANGVDAAPEDSGVVPLDTSTSFDSGRRLDTARYDTHEGFDVPPYDTGHVDVSPPPPTGCEATVGKACTAAADCDPLGTGDGTCIAYAYPTPVCIETSCDPGDGTKIVACDNCDGIDRGVCLSEGSGGGICLPACSFADDGAAAKGCVGKDACVPFGWTTTSPPITGIGYCYGGCFADADCPTGTRCQIEQGTCVKTLTSFAKKPGDACTYKTTPSAVQDCNCYASYATNKGYCSSFCEPGDSTHACPGALKCTGGLPTACASGSPLFTKTPSGLYGYCLLPCVADADCKDPSGADIASACRSTTDGKFCMPYDPGGGC
jgi:hypothetical protein